MTTFKSTRSFRLNAEVSTGFSIHEQYERRMISRREYTELREQELTARRHLAVVSWASAPVDDCRIELHEMIQLLRGLPEEQYAYYAEMARTLRREHLIGRGLAPETITQAMIDPDYVEPAAPVDPPPAEVKTGKDPEMTAQNLTTIPAPANQPEIEWHETKCALAAVVKELRAQIFAIQPTLGWSDHNKLCGALNEIEHAIRGNWRSAARHEATIAEFCGADLAHQYERALYALICHDDKLPAIRAAVDAAIAAQQESAAPVDPAPASRIPAAVAIDAEMDDEAGFSELESGFERPAIIAGPVLDAHGQSWYDRHKIAPEPAAVDTGTQHGPALAEIIPQTVIAENAHYQLLAEDGAAFLAAHDRKQAARKLANRLTVKPAPLSPGFNIYDQGAKIAYLGRYKDFGNRWYYNVHGCPDGGFATSAEALEHLAARHFA